MLHPCRAARREVEATNCAANLLYHGEIGLEIERPSFSVLATAFRVAVNLVTLPPSRSFGLTAVPLTDKSVAAKNENCWVVLGILVP